jgi:hypothetical protein
VKGVLGDVSTGAAVGPIGVLVIAVVDGHGQLGVRDETPHLVVAPQGLHRQLRRG